jgi:hypothetical protein
MQPAETPSGDRYTDISGAIAASAQATESLPGRKILVVLSDFVEQEAPTVPSTTFSLHGERVVLVHRPGLDDRTLAAHVDRIREWKHKLEAAGASAVTAIPEEWVTSGLVSRILDNTIDGTFGIVLIDPPTLNSLGTDDERKERLTMIAQAVGNLSRTWKPPVTILWHVIAASSARVASMPALEYQPRLVEREGEINSLDALQVALRETAIGTMRLLGTAGYPTSPLSSTIALTHASDVLRGSPVHLLLISDLVNSDGGARPDTRLLNETVSLIYAPSITDKSDPNKLFARIRNAKTTLVGAGAKKVCAFDLSTMVPSQLAGCAKDSQ